ncbi:corrinoid adenosyltransferase-like [Portunus trituberculatus]|uniref:corrinoid adenosyltransferase-like n=1 Tax=Portunus trituberculatus TaxID=210409 RepID=UPI001E1D0E07|nr:corrinoid adenosyltransferase-like [Portunus trituberculatus]
MAHLHRYTMSLRTFLPQMRLGGGLCEQTVTRTAASEINRNSDIIWKPFCRGMKIYTRTGDKGVTALFTGERLPKNTQFFNALGTTDELSSHLGLVKAHAEEKRHEYVDQLERIQCILQDISSLLATPRTQELSDDPEREARVLKRLSFNPRHITELEEWIDRYDSRLPPLTNFILPGGGQVSAALHVARTVCRRTEREIVPLITEDLVDDQVLSYINRLSDYLFTIARYAALLEGKKETIYIQPKIRSTGKIKDKVQENQEIIQSDG